MYIPEVSGTGAAPSPRTHFCVPPAITEVAAYAVSEAPTFACLIEPLFDRPVPLEVFDDGAACGLALLHSECRASGY